MAKQHFFQPLLPGFHTHLTIPVVFFMENIEGRYEQKMAELRSDASKITWKVKLEDGRRLTDGWKEFALSHDLRVGDIVVFRQEKYMAFHVQLFGPSCCEIQYGSCLKDQNNLGKIQRKKKVKKNPRRVAESSSLDPSCFAANVTPTSLREDRVNLPRSFVRANVADTICGEIVLMNEKGRSWTLALKQKKSCGTVYMRRGWRSFCNANGLKARDFFTFKLSRKGGTLILRLFPKEEEECLEADEIVSLLTESDGDKESSQDEKSFKKRRSIWKASSSASQNLGTIQRKKNPKMKAESSLEPSCFVAYVAPFTLRYDILYLPKRFVKANDLDTNSGEIVLMNGKGKSWNLALKQKNSCGTMYITRGWRSFCSSNGLKEGDLFTFKLIQRGRSLVLRMSPKESKEEECSEGDDVESLSTDSGSNQDEKSCKKRRSVWKASSSPSQNRFVTLSLTPYNVERCKLFLPARFTRINGIDEETKMTLLDNHGVKWSTNLRYENRRIKMVGGWKNFFTASDVNTNESVKLKLIWEEEDTSCVLKFCSKVKPKTK